MPVKLSQKWIFGLENKLETEKAKKPGWGFDLRTRSLRVSPWVWLPWIFVYSCVGSSLSWESIFEGGYVCTSVLTLIPRESLRTNTQSFCLCRETLWRGSLSCCLPILSLSDASSRVALAFSSRCMRPSLFRVWVLLSRVWALLFSSLLKSQLLIYDEYCINVSGVEYDRKEGCFGCWDASEKE